MIEEKKYFEKNIINLSGAQMKFTIRDDGYINLTQIAKFYGKWLDDYTWNNEKNKANINFFNQINKELDENFNPGKSGIGI